MIRSGLSGANLRNSFARVYAARPLPTITTLLIQFPPKKYGPIARRALLRHFDHLEVGLGHAAIRTFPIARNRDQAVLGAMPSTGMPLLDLGQGREALDSQFPRGPEALCMLLGFLDLLIEFAHPPHRCAPARQGGGSVDTFQCTRTSRPEWQVRGNWTDRVHFWNTTDPCVRRHAGVPGPRWLRISWPFPRRHTGGTPRRRACTRYAPSIRRQRRRRGSGG